MRFPIDCPPDCPHLQSWDLSIDDYTYVCDVLKKQIDGYDCGFKGLLPLCPLEQMEDVEDGKSTGLISTRDDNIIAWMPLPEPYKEDKA